MSPACLVVLAGLSAPVGAPSDLMAWTPRGTRLVESYGPWSARTRGGSARVVLRAGRVVNVGRRPVVVCTWRG